MALFGPTSALSETLYESPFHRVERQRGFLRMTRTGEPYPELAAIEREYQALVEALDPHKGQRLGLLVDLREARGRNDPGFETALQSWRKRSLEGHSPLVVIVRTTLGQMHVERHMREDGLRATVTTDEAEAVRLAQLRP